MDNSIQEQSSFFFFFCCVNSLLGVAWAQAYPRTVWAGLELFQYPFETAPSCTHNGVMSVSIKEKVQPIWRSFFLSSPFLPRLFKWPLCVCMCVWSAHASMRMLGGRAWPVKTFWKSFYLHNAPYKKVMLHGAPSKKNKRFLLPPLSKAQCLQLRAWNCINFLTLTILQKFEVLWNFFCWQSVPSS